MTKKQYLFIKKLIPYVTFALGLLIILLVCKQLIISSKCVSIVSGSSMYPTLVEGQKIYDGASDGFERGDIVTSLFPEFVEREDEIIVKRIIGIPGDYIRICESGVYVNGEKIEEDYLTEEAKANTFYKSRDIVATLGEDEYYLMGDNREVSYDSRAFGAVTEDRLLYKQSEYPASRFWILIGKSLLVILVVNIFNLYLDEKCQRLLALYWWEHRRNAPKE